MLRIMAIAGLLVSMNIHAAQITPAAGVKILFTNGVAVEEPLKPTSLDSDTVQLVVRYADELGRGSNKKVFDSPPFVITIEKLNEDIKLYPPSVFSYEQANREFQSSPKWRIESKDGNEVAYVQEKLQGHDGFMPYYDIDSLIAKHNKERGIVFDSVLATVEATPAKSPVALGEVASSAQEASSLQQLQHWYTQATTEERKAFRKWMVDQE
ncbi:DUF2057 domain-containing protein [Vibrio sp. IRLE0018]|uniref:YccT family protein n=1 Tax=Vibrio TaxID=662 RepID=UPI00159430C1|nr:MULTISPECIES: DUF2057 domain-containing protein [Vibrio]MCF8778094.1 DUF2057 domain-containing protein [Vibrio floridensis]NVC63614.1 DUF2057 domain-containing protein [Vibrio sp. 05-20-BW147]